MVQISRLNVNTVKDVEWPPTLAITFLSMESDIKSDGDQTLTASELDDD